MTNQMAMENWTQVNIWPPVIPKIQGDGNETSTAETSNTNLDS